MSWYNAGLADWARSDVVDAATQRLFFRLVELQPPPIGNLLPLSSTLRTFFLQGWSCEWESSESRNLLARRKGLKPVLCAAVDAGSTDSVADSVKALRCSLVCVAKVLKWYPRVWLVTRLLRPWTYFFCSPRQKWSWGVILMLQSPSCSFSRPSSCKNIFFLGQKFARLSLCCHLGNNGQFWTNSVWHQYGTLGQCKEYYPFGP